MYLFIATPLRFVDFGCLKKVQKDMFKSELGILHIALILVADGLFYQTRKHCLVAALYPGWRRLEETGGDWRRLC